MRPRSSAVGLVEEPSVTQPIDTELIEPVCADMGGENHRRSGIGWLRSVAGAKVISLKRSNTHDLSYPRAPS
jgi:hypothetical protein